jgi:hypothetical protein
MLGRWRRVVETLRAAIAGCRSIKLRVDSRKAGLGPNVSRRSMHTASVIKKLHALRQGAEAFLVGSSAHSNGVKRPKKTNSIRIVFAAMYGSVHVS